jgi:chromosomal replication initiation ATPase DnaA
VFHLIERAKDMNKALLISWRNMPEAMQPPELSSRLLMMERVDMAPPHADADLKAVLESVLQTMQWDMKDTVLPTLLQHIPRTLSDLLQAIDTLDMYSREHRAKMNGALALKVLHVHD